MPKHRVSTCINASAPRCRGALVICDSPVADNYLFSDGPDSLDIESLFSFGALLVGAASGPL